MPARAENLHENTIVADNHHQMANQFIQLKLARDENSAFDSFYSNKLRAGGVNLVNMVIGKDHVAKVINDVTDVKHFWDANKKLDLLLSEESESNSFLLCRDEDDIYQAFKENKIAVITSLEGGRALEGKPNLNLLSNLRNLYRLGLRGVQLTGNGRNRLADGVGQSRTGGGLTRFGVKVVKEMERLGMVLDVAQLSEASFEDVLNISNGLIIDSHSCASGICNHERNISDHRIIEIANRGGFVGLSFYSALVNDDKSAPTLNDLVRHIEYIVDLVGIDHVALGPDYSSFDTLTPTQRERHPGEIEGIKYQKRESDYIKGPDKIEKLSLLTSKLVEEGYSEEEIEKILGGNSVRVYRKVLA